MHVDFVCAHLFTCVNSHQAVIARSGGSTAINGQPARLYQYLAFGFEGVAFYSGNAGGDIEFRWREKHSQETFHHQVVQLGFGFAQILGHLQGRNNRKVIRNLAVVKYALVRFYPVIFQNLFAERAVHTRNVPGLQAHKASQGLVHCGHVIFRQCL